MDAAGWMRGYNDTCGGLLHADLWCWRHPIEHDYELEKDVNAAVDVLLARTDISSDRACLYSHTRGGYYTLKVATTFKRQQREIACYVSYYPHLQDPNAPEPQQVYGYAPEIDLLT